MDANFPRALELVLKEEGGWADHPKDPGGATNLGITIGTLSDWLGRPATKADVRALTKQTVAPIYRKRYWDKVRGDDLPTGLDFAVFDFAVNSGVSRASKYLQAILGVPQDGQIGPVTVAAAKAADVTVVIERLCGNRMEFLEGLSSFAVFGRGWTDRVTHVLEAALLMTVSAVPPPPDIPSEPASPPAKPPPRPSIPVIHNPSPPHRWAIPGWLWAIFVIIGLALLAGYFITN